METILGAAIMLFLPVFQSGLPATDKVRLRSFSHSKASVHCLTFVSNEFLTFGGGDPFGPGEVHLLNIRTGEKKPLPGKHALAVHSLALDSAKTGLFSGGGNGEVWYRSLKDPIDVYKLDGESEYTYNFAPLPGGRCAWSGDKVVVVFDQKSKKKLFNVNGVKDNAIGWMAYIERLGHLVLADCWELKVVELTKGEIVRTMDASDQRGTASFALWQKKSWLINFSRYGPDPKTPDLTAQIFDLKNGKVVSRFAYEKDPVIAAVMCEEDGLVITGTNAGTLGVLRLADGKTILRIPAHDGCLRSLSISPDGALLASCGDDRKINIYDLNKIREAAK